MHKSFLEKIYKKYNRRNFVHPDPLEFLYLYSNLRDREIVGVIASSLAYGRVKQILKSILVVLEKVGKSPYKYLMSKSDRDIAADFKGFKHRFTTGSDKADLLIGMKHVIKRYGSLYKCFEAGYDSRDKNYNNALSFLIREITSGAGVKKLALLPLPELGSACKRLNLFLRWMIRKDEVDPGGWNTLSPSKLIVPLDTHMYKIGKRLKYTSRKQANLKTAIEITQGFAKASPKDPVKYDFALTRFGIRNELDLNQLFA